jgi:hypothetical protein
VPLQLPYLQQRLRKGKKWRKGGKWGEIRVQEGIEEMKKERENEKERGMKKG